MVDAATPVAKIPSAIIEASRLSLWTMAIATRVQAAWMNRHAHLSGLTRESLNMMRCRRASNAVSSAVAMSRCAIFWPSLLGFKARVACSASASTPGPEVGRTLSHHGPFLGCNVSDVPGQLTKLNLELFREASGANRGAS